MRPKGFKMSEESKRKISETHKRIGFKPKTCHLRGKDSFTYGKKWDESRRKKLSERNKRLGLIPPSRKGIKCSKEIRENMSRGQKGKIYSIETRKKCSLLRRGNKSNLWKGGVSNLQKILRSCFKYRQWRSDVFTRDDFTCKSCGVRGGKLQVDHIKPLSIILKENNVKTFEEDLICEEIWNMNNGRTLCIECHKKTDTYMEGAKKWQSKL